MSISTSSGDYFSSRPSIRTRPPNIRGATATSPRSPRTPLLGRSISSQFGSPGTFRTEQEDTVIYELNQRYLVAGFAGEKRPRCVIPFTPDSGRRVGDYRPFLLEYQKSSRRLRLEADWGAGYELYRLDLNSIDLGLVEDRLDRALRTAHTDFLQLDSKSRKASLIVSSLFPTPLLEIALKVIFGHFAQPSAITVMTHPILNCVGAGLRDGLVIDIGWEEVVVTAVGEYKEVLQRRSVRAGKLLTKETARIVEYEAGKVPDKASAEVAMTFAEADEVTKQAACCRPRQASSLRGMEPLLIPGSESEETFPVQSNTLAEATERTFFPSDKQYNEYDDDELPLHLLVYKALLALPSDLRTICMSRLIVSGCSSNIEGLEERLLHELSLLIESKSWDTVHDYGSNDVKRREVLQERSINILNERLSPETLASKITLSPMKMPIQDGISHADRVHDDIQDPVTLKAERNMSKGRKNTVSGKFRWVRTIGSWAGASMMISMRIKGHCEIERDDFNRHGLRNASTTVL